ncbi:hypothetical protein [Vibrio sinensis]|uniref:hypothetical protein n=1 Tax=Vibrio sinensis TaxID=2302434 RepID=UPI0014035411|nr:hypothetical protein [Vibrio sinensis]
MSAIKKIEQSALYVILYFNGERIVPLEVWADSRQEAIEALREIGFNSRDIFSITP